MSLKGKRYIVSGGGRGIGLELCKFILDAGGLVAILDILAVPHPDCQALLQHSERCHYFNCDITNAATLESGFLQSLSSLGGRIDGCITNAGIGTDKPFLEHTWDDFDKVVRVNQAGTFFLAQLTVAQLLKQSVDENTGIRGSIVMIASASASQQCPGHLLTAYGGSKGFVKSFCIQLSHEFAAQGIRANSVSPGYIETDLNLNLAKIRPEVEHYFREAPPLKRMGRPRDVAGGVLYLLSDAASYITGHDLVIDGGMRVATGLSR